MNYFRRARLFKFLLLAYASNIRVWGSPAFQVATDLRRYVDALNSSRPAQQASPFVFGAKANSHSWERSWKNERAQASRHSSNSPMGIEWRGVEGVRVQGEQAQATVKFYWFSLPRQETLQLKRGHKANGTVWQIVPHNSPNLAFAPRQPLEQAAFFLSRGSEVQPLSNAKIEMRSLKNLTVNLFSRDPQNNNPLFTSKAITAAQARTRGRLEIASLQVGQTGDFYQFNANLEGKRLAGLSQPNRTVLLYDGSSHRLRPRYNGKGVVAFADGHIELLTPQQFTTKIW